MITQKKITMLIKKLESMLRSNLCDYSDACIVAKGDITLEDDNDASKPNKNLAFKNNAPFVNCISKINGVQIDNAEYLDVVMPMHNLLEYRKKSQKNNKQFVELLQRLAK